MNKGQIIAVIIVLIIVVVWVLPEVGFDPLKIKTPEEKSDPAATGGTGSSGAGAGSSPPPATLPPAVARVIANNVNGVDKGLLTGTLYGSAYVDGDGVIVLTKPTSYTHGGIVYKGTLPDSFVVRCNLRAYGGNGADGFGIFFNKGVQILGEADGEPGHTVTVQEYYNYINLVEKGKELARIGYGNDGQWHAFEIKFLKDQVTVTRDGAQILQASVDRSVIGGNMFGIVARCGRVNNYHCISGYSLTEIL